MSKEEVSREMDLMDKESFFSTERFGYSMFQVIGIVMIAVGVARFFMNLTQAAFWANILLFGIGMWFFVGALWSSIRHQPTPAELKWLREREENQLTWESNTYGFAHNIHSSDAAKEYKENEIVEREKAAQSGSIAELSDQYKIS